MTHIATADACLANVDHDIVGIFEGRLLSILKCDVLDGSQDKGRILVIGLCNCHCMIWNEMKIPWQ